MLILGFAERSESRWTSLPFLSRDPCCDRTLRILFMKLSRLYFSVALLTRYSSLQLLVLNPFLRFELFDDRCVLMLFSDRQPLMFESFRRLRASDDLDRFFPESLVSLLPG